MNIPEVSVSHDLFLASYLYSYETVAIGCYLQAAIPSSSVTW
jgi:hypothetical protein